MITKQTLPKGWSWVKLGDYCQQIDYGYTASANFQITEPRLLRITDIQNGNVDWDKVPGCEINTREEEANLLADSDIVFARTGATTGKSFLIKNPPRAVFASYLIRVRPTPQIFPDFLYAFFQSDEYWKQIRLRARGAAQPNVNATLLSEILIPLVPLDEQKHIVARLDEQMRHIEEARQAAEESLSAAWELPSAYLSEMFEKELTNQYPSKTLGDICQDITDGTHVTPKYISEGIPFLSVKDVKETGLLFNNCRYISEEQHRELTKKFKPEFGDVLYTKVGTTGIAKAVDVNREFSIFVSVALLKLKRDVVLPDYLETALNSPFCRKQAENLTQGMANRNLVLKDLKRISLPIPPLKEQEQITKKAKDKIAAGRAIYKTIESQLAEINELPSAVLGQAFAGELST